MLQNYATDKKWNKIKIWRFGFDLSETVSELKVIGWILMIKRFDVDHKENPLPLTTSLRQLFFRIKQAWNTGKCIAGLDIR